MQLQAEEDARARSPQPGSGSSSSSHHTPTKKRVKEEKAVDDDDEEDGNAFGSRKKRKTTPVKAETPTKAAGSSSSSSSAASKKATPSKKAPSKAAVKKEEKKAAEQPAAAAEDGGYEEMDEKKAAEEKRKKRLSASAQRAAGSASDTPTASPDCACRPLLLLSADMKAFAARPSTLGVVKEIPEGAAGCLFGQSFVLSGVLDSLERDAAQTLIERYGGRVVGSVSGKTSFLVLGQDGGESKRKKAQELRTPIIDEDGLLELIRTRKGQALNAGAAATAKGAAAKAKKAQSASQTAAKGVSASVNAATSQGRQLLRVHGQTADRAQDMLWVDKHRPMSLAHVIGNESCVKRLQAWLKGWDDNFRYGAKPEKGSFKAALITGAPGIGKSTSATLVARSTHPPAAACLALHRARTVLTCLLSAGC